MIFFIYGTDHYRCREQLKALKDQFIQKKDQTGGLNVITLDAASFDFEKFKQELMTVPFLGEKKMIVVKNILSQKKKYEPVYKLIKDRDFDNALVFADFLINEKKAQPRGEFFDWLKKQKFVWEFNLLAGFALEKWLGQYLKIKKVDAEPAAIKELAIRAGNDLEAATKEIDKLIAYKNGAKIAKEDIALNVKAKFDDNIFNLVDAIAGKNKKLAVKLITDQLESGQSPLMILNMVIRQFRLIIQVKNGGASGLGLHPFVARKTTAQANNFSENNLKSIYDDLLAMERNLKSTTKNPELLFDLFIFKYC
jgi:DNA polymerase III subunit delta